MTITMAVVAFIYVLHLFYSKVLKLNTNSGAEKLAELTGAKTPVKEIFWTNQRAT